MMRLAGHVVLMGDEKYMNAKFSWGNQKEKGRLKDLNVKGKIILKFTLHKEDGRSRN